MLHDHHLRFGLWSFNRALNLSQLKLFEATSLLSMLILCHWDCTGLLIDILYLFTFFVLIVFHVGSPFVAGYGYNSLGFAQSNPYKRRVSTLDRKYASGTNRAHWNKLMTISSSVSRMQHLDTTMASLANLTAAPPAALYNPLDHGRSLAKEVRK